MKISNVLALVLLLLFPIATTACSGSGTSASTDGATSLSLCGDCGQIKGGEVCCAADAATCGDCQLAKGSPGCCKMEKGADAALCKCGMIKGTDGCCAEDAAECADCDKIKGSPGCCQEG